jgi:peptidoglycan/LPS O-acetylase OafA/YrhL
MTSALEVPTDGSMLPSGLEIGTAPGDRRFRPDVEGLRAVAVLLVVLYHASFPGLSGGYVGVDVFFVISGFVITGVLLRERASTGGTSILHFYGRRCRRIIPAATLVIIATVTLAYVVLGVVYGTRTAVDGRWTSVFLANVHFASVGTNYLSSQQSPSLLQNFWSLAVEEQFYLVYPTLFLVAAAVRSRVSLHVRLATGLIVVIVASFVLSVAQTASDPTVAYFSPLTRAWELALGALVAVSAKWLLALSKGVAATMTWVGLGAILIAAFGFDSTTAYPGWLVAVPVVGAALIIAGGTPVPRHSAESILGLTPFQWTGRLSYSIYLWHWPILTLAADAAGKLSLPFRQNLVWLAVALAASMATFRLVENPVRHARLPVPGPWAPVGLGVLLIALSFGLSSVELAAHGGATTPVPTGGAGTSWNNRVALIDVEALVAAAPSIRTLPTDLTPTLAHASSDWGGPSGECWPAYGTTSIPACTFGDPTGTHTMVLYGDSHAGMWLDAMVEVASQAHWRVAYLGKGSCPADSLTFQNPPGYGRPGGEYAACDQWHRFALQRINSLHPDLVVITQEVRGQPHGYLYSAQQWSDGLAATLDKIHVPRSKVVVLGNVPVLPRSGPECLSRNTDDVQKCSGPLTAYLKQYNQAEQTTTTGAGARYVDTTPWFCSTVCTAVIGRYEVYFDRYHITGSYSMALGPVLAGALDLPTTAKAAGT